MTEARQLLSGMERFSPSGAYDPTTDKRPFTIAASDYQIEIIIKPLINRLRSIAPQMQLRVLRAHAQDEWVGLLRAGSTDLVLSIELKTNESDLMLQRVLSEDEDICYCDPAHRAPPNTLDRYCAAPHVIMAPGKFRTTIVDQRLAEQGRHRQIALSLPSFSTGATILRGTDMVALMPFRLRSTVFAGIATCPPPFDLSRDTITQTWHSKTYASPRHRWLRAQVQAAVTGTA
ncbi:LysR substrate-binding domain-containing protein [Phaeobacter sp. C3_T13_0]|uniref:LysR substrate-binding domain-containing protein n=1 Tax=Phaeobacter cretensis TaxID=3342641 RepID=UPI0039BCC521